MEAGASRQDADMMVLASSVLSRGSSALWVISGYRWEVNCN
jgi:hypothetical protein